MITRPSFTKEQEDWICSQIDEWYFVWTSRIVAGAAFHKLEIAKEHLKEWICGEKKDNSNGE